MLLRGKDINVFEREREREFFLSFLSVCLLARMDDYENRREKDCRMKSVVDKVH